ncbi:MAG: hypothetical protein J0L75_06350 [Spirochaetes bacterium]|nr:hypothetical protein [Spirochaetota bacterium]
MANHHDAELILKLYDLRREEVCRKARAWFGAWTPLTADEVRAVVSGERREENAYMRQATSYWEMAFSIANNGAVDAPLFAKNCGEGYWFVAKCQGLKAKFPDAWQRTMAEGEAFIAGNLLAQSRFEMFQKRVGAQLK